MIYNKKVAMIVSPKNFRDEELFETKEILEQRRIKVDVVSKGVTEAYGMLGGKVAIDRELSSVDENEYDAYIFVGGNGATVYFNDPFVLGFIRKIDSQNKILAAICIAPSILANAQVLKNHKATAFPSEQQNLQNNGVFYTGESVTLDGKFITAKGPKDAIEFGNAIAKAVL